MASTLGSGIVAPSTLLTPLLHWREERRVADVITVRDESVPLPAAPGITELESYYKENTSRFMAPEYRALTVLLLQPVDVAGSIAIDETMIKEAYQQRQEEFNTPERRQVSQIVIDS